MLAFISLAGNLFLCKLLYLEHVQLTVDDQYTCAYTSRFYNCYFSGWEEGNILCKLVPVYTFVRHQTNTSYTGTSSHVIFKNICHLPRNTD
jgi:hypothetical protein